MRFLKKTFENGNDTGKHLCFEVKKNDTNARRAVVYVKSREFRGLHDDVFKIEPINGVRFSN